MLPSKRACISRKTCRFYRYALARRAIPPSSALNWISFNPFSNWHPLPFLHITFFVYRGNSSLAVIPSVITLPSHRFNSVWIPGWIGNTLSLQFFEMHYEVNIEIFFRKRFASITCEVIDKRPALNIYILSFIVRRIYSLVKISYLVFFYFTRYIYLKFTCFSFRIKLEKFFVQTLIETVFILFIVRKTVSRKW